MLVALLGLVLVVLLPVALILLGLLVCLASWVRFPSPPLLVRLAALFFASVQIVLWLSALLLAAFLSRISLLMAVLMLVASVLVLSVVVLA
jgi:hypothetical protein